MVFITHAVERMQERKISVAELEEILNSPDEVIKRSKVDLCKND